MKDICIPIGTFANQKFRLSLISISQRAVINSTLVLQTPVRTTLLLLSNTADNYQQVVIILLPNGEYYTIEAHYVEGLRFLCKYGQSINSTDMGATFIQSETFWDQNNRVSIAVISIDDSGALG